jgi:RNA polymerase sigma-70 factor (ECF subfamily)
LGSPLAGVVEARDPGRDAVLSPAGSQIGCRNRLDRSRHSLPAMPEKDLAARAKAPLVEPFAEHDRYVRALLRRIVEDEHLVEDLAQETWLSALRHAAGGALLQRAWLGTVARNFALQAIRGSARRRARERDVARPATQEALRSPLDPDQAQRLLAAVERLDEPYRTVVRLRFFDDLPPSLIAERLSVPVETVRTRLKRALVLVREAYRAPRSA